MKVVIEMSKQKEMLHMLNELVMMDSGSYDKSGVDNVGSYLINAFNELGFVETIVKQEEYGNHILLKQKKTNKQPSILLMLHMDTVFPVGTSAVRPFMVKDDKAYGPGVADMKGSHVTTYFALKTLYETNPTILNQIDVLFTSDEEIGAPSGRSIIEEQAIGKKAVLVMEPARKDGSVVTFRRGGGRYVMRVEGIAAHSGNDPEKGASAVEELAYKIIALHQLSDATAGIHVNVGVIRGGTAVNTVADYAEADIDIRLSKMEQASELEAAIESIANETRIKGTSTTVKGRITRPPMMRSNKTIQLYELVREQARLVGIEVGETSSGGGSDASYTSALGIPTIDGMGPVGSGFHSEEEYLQVTSLQERTTLLSNVIQRVLSKGVVFK